MSFVKLDCGILNSTLWVERGSRDVFITALLMATPRQFDEPQAQIATDSLDLTGFVIPAGWYGFVAAAGPGIVRMSLLDRDEGMEALRKLGEPDAESRSSEFEGRRLVRVDGGYIVLNYMRYRDHDTNAATRMKLLRERKKNAAIVTENIVTVTANELEHGNECETLQRIVTEAEAEAERAKDKEANASSVKPSVSPCPVEAIKELYHELLPELPKCQKITSKRRASIQQRWREDLTDLDDWRLFFTDYVRKSDFLMGKSAPTNGHKLFRADLEWITNPSNYAKILEGKYRG